MANPVFLAEDSNGDWQGNVLLSGQDAAAQAILTRLQLYQGEWFNDQTDGTPYFQDIIGRNTNYDLEIKQRIMQTTLSGVNVVKSIDNYSSNIIDRALSVTASVNTIYGIVNITF